jgi:hypothetical protein
MRWKRKWYAVCSATGIMSSFITSLYAILPYLLAFWTIPFVIIAIKMMRRPPLFRNEEAHRVAAPTDPWFDNRPWTIEDPAILGENLGTPPPIKHRSAAKLPSHFDF